MRTRCLLLTVFIASLVMAAPAAASAGGLELTESKQLTARLSELTMSTPALDFPVRVRILLPAGYRDDPRRRLPRALPPARVLRRRRLLDRQGQRRAPHRRPAADRGDARHRRQGQRRRLGLGLAQRRPRGTAQMGDVHHRPAAPMGRCPLPHSGGTGRAGGGRAVDGRVQLHELPPSATPTCSSPPRASPERLTPTTARCSPSSSWKRARTAAPQPDAIWGPRAVDEVYWRTHKPWDLAGNLRGMTLSIRTGNGQHPPGESGPPDPIEGAVHDMSVSLHGRLGALGIPTSGTTTAPAPTPGPTGSATSSSSCRGS